MMGSLRVKLRANAQAAIMERLMQARIPGLEIRPANQYSSTRASEL
jgi:hypothetical protein